VRRPLTRYLPVVLVPLAVTWVVAPAAWWGAAVIAAGTAVVIGVLVLASGGARALAGGPRAWFAALLAWTAIDAALRPVAVWDAARVVAAGVVALAVLVVTASPRGAAWGRLAAVAAGMAAAVWLIAERLARAGRPAGPLGNPNLAATLALVALALAPFLRAPLLARGLMVAGAAAGIAASGSRAGLVGVLAVAAAWALVGMGGRRRWAVVLPLVLLAVAGLGMRLATDRDPLRYERVRIWAVGLRTAAAELPLGGGPGGYEDAALPHNFPRDGEFARLARLPDVAESDFLQLAATLGLPGVVLLAALVCSVVRCLAPGDAHGWGLVAGVTVTSGFNSQLMFPALAWVVALAIGGVLPRPRPWRGTLSLPAAAAVTALVVATAAVLGSRDWGAGPSPVALADRAEAALRAAPNDDSALAAAEAEAWRSCAARPRLGVAWRTLGGIRLRRATLLGDAGLAEAAVEAFARARLVNPLDAWAALGEAQARRATGDAVGARRALAAALQLEPNFVSAWLESAILHLARGEMGTAREALGRAEDAARRAPRAAFVSDYERALAWADPATVARLASATGERR